MILRTTVPENTVLNDRPICSVNESEVTDSVTVLQNTSTDSENTDYTLFR